MIPYYIESIVDDFDPNFDLGPSTYLDIGSEVEGDDGIIYKVIDISIQNGFLCITVEPIKT